MEDIHDVGESRKCDSNANKVTLKACLGCISKGRWLWRLGGQKGMV